MNRPGRYSVLGTRGSWLVARGAAVAIALALVAHLQAAPARNFLWKATARSGGVLYLVGSVHLLSQDSYPLNPALETAFKDSDLLVEEATWARWARTRS